MFTLLLAANGIWLAENPYMSKVINGWIAGSQEFLYTRLPHLLVIAVIAYLLNKLLHVVSHRMIRVAERHGAGPGRLAEVRTLAGVIRTTGLAIIGLIVGLQVLDAVGLDLGPLLASAGVAGIAIGLAAQNIVRDVLNGVLILIEGQFSVGDMVKLAGFSGTVETMTLRKTTVRDNDGTLYVIPNSQITTVANLSAGYTSATVNVSVDISAHPDQVLDLLKSVAMEVRNSDEFKNLFIADPQVLGVDAVKGSETIYPVVFKTLANQQYGPIREFRRRVSIALDEHHLLPGDPYRVFNPSASQVAPGAAQGAAAAPPPTHEAAPPRDPASPPADGGNPFTS